MSPECTGFLPPLGGPGLRCVTEGEQGQETVLGASCCPWGHLLCYFPELGRPGVPTAPNLSKCSLQGGGGGGPREQWPRWRCRSVTCPLPVPGLTVAQDSLGLGAYPPSGPQGCGREVPWAPILPHSSRAWSWGAPTPHSSMRFCPQEGVEWGWLQPGDEAPPCGLATQSAGCKFVASAPPAPTAQKLVETSPSAGRSGNRPPGHACAQ